MVVAEERLALIEVVERDGRVLLQLGVQRWPLTIGRAFDRDLVLEDPHVAAAHAQLVPDDEGRLWLEVGADTHNGVRIGRRTLRAGERVEIAPGGEALHFGLTRLRVRRAGDTIAPERLLVGLSSARTLVITGIVTLALWALLIVQHWIASDPTANLTGWLPVLIGPPLALVLWCAVWAMASKLFQHRFEFAGHWAFAVRGALLVMLAGTVLAHAAAALAWPWLFRVVGLVELAIVATWLFRHARLVLPTHTRALALSFGAALVAGIGVMMLLNHQREERLLGPLYMHLLPHPVWRVTNPVTPDKFVDRARAARAALDARARAESDDDESGTH